jgi:Zn-finger nucleic acid-binding protein
MAPDAGALHCPNCGGPASPGDAACRYCRAKLATVSCPSCFALMFDGAVYCPACGARRARAEGSARQAPCPACKGAMREVTIGDTGLLECERCHGTWVDAKTFEHICASKEAQAAVLHQWSAGDRPVASGEVRYRKCVACATIMNRVNFGRLSGTVVDVCRGHGTFLDAGELHAIVRFIQQGGLDRARERQLQDLKEQEERLRALQTQRSMGGGAPVDISFQSNVWTGDLQAFLNYVTKVK